MKFYTRSLLLLAIGYLSFVANADAAVTVKPVNVSGGVTAPTGTAATPTRAPGATRLGGGTAISGDTAAGRGASAPRMNTISKHLQSTSNTLKPGSSIKVPGAGGGGNVNVDLSNYYTIPQTDALLDLKQNLIIAGDCINIVGDEISVDNSCVGAGTGTGQDGREVQMRMNGDYIQWKYDTEAATEWRNLIAIAELKGADGREVQMQYNVSTGYIQWRLIGNPSWNDLVDLGSLDLGNKQDRSSEPTAVSGNVAIWGSNGQTVTGTTITNDGITIGGSDSGLTTGKAVYEYVNSVVPQYPPQECVDAITGQLTCVLGQQWDSVNSKLEWVWLPLEI